MLEIRLLGQFDVRLDGKPVGIPTRSAQSLLAYLFLNSGVAHRREKLAGLLWPDASEANARSNLRHELWRLRKAIEIGRPPGGEYILADEIGIGVNTSADYWLDVAELEKGSGDLLPTDLLVDHLANYRGELLPGFYDDWVVLERTRAQALFEQKIQLLLDRFQQEQRWQETLDWSERWIALGQCPEPAYRALMMAHAALGDQSKVATTFRRCAESLRTELGVEPSAQTRALFERLTRGETLTPTSVAPSLAAPPQAAASAWEEPPAPGEAPFRGLRYFDEEDADWFFGRETLVARIVGRLRAGHPLTVVVGASGSGKSSFLRAGIFPALKRGQPLADGTLPPEGCSRWQFHLITPGAHPLEAVAVSLTRDSSSVAATAGLIDDLTRDPRSLHLAIVRLLRSRKEEHIVLAVDQFEELFTLCRDTFEREAFVDNLLAAVASDRAGRTTVMLALRADFYPHVAQYPELRDAVAWNQEYLGPMSVEELRRAIEEPARRGGWKFEPGLVDLFLREVAEEPGALPLLSHALLETWKRRRGRTLMLKGYAESGGVRGAIAQTAQTVYENLPAERQAIARNIFLRLTELGEGTLDTRRRATIHELIPSPEDAPAVEQVLTLLADARLVTTGEGTVEVAHEALIREWPTLREWLNQDREGLRVHRRLAEAAREWERLERDPDALYRGAQMVRASDWAKLNMDALNPLEREFLAASSEAASSEADEREAQRRREMEAAQKLAEVEKHRALAAQKAEAHAEVAFSRELAAAAISDLETDPERSILLAVEAVQAADTREAEVALHRALLASRVQLTLRGHSGEVWSVAFSPDGTRLATASQDKTAKVWDAATGTEILTLAGHGESVSSVAFSPDGTRLATGSQDKTAKVWDAATGKETLTLVGHTSGINHVAFSPDGTRLATASRDRTTKIWDSLTGEEKVTLRRHLHKVLDVAFGPRGKLIATASQDGSAIIWDAATGADLLTARGDFSAVAFTPDETRLVAADGRTAKVLDVLTGAILLTLLGHTNSIDSLALSVDGARVATGSLDKTARVWDTATGRVLFTLTGHGDGVVGLAFSSDGARLATASTDGTVRVWNIGPSCELLTLSMPAESSRVALSPDWNLLAVGLSDGTVRVREMDTGKEVLRLAGHTQGILGIAFSPDGRRLATASRDGTAKVWDVMTGEELHTLSGHRQAVTQVAFSPDGNRLVTVGHDWNAKVWDAHTGLELFSHPFSYQVHSGALSPDGMRLAAGDIAATVKVWDLAAGKHELTLLDHSEAVLDVAFSADGRRLATASLDGTVKLWDAVTGRRQFTLSGHTGAVEAAAFSPDDLYLATAGSDGTTRIWDIAAGQMLLTLAPPDGKALENVTFSSDGSKLAAIGKEELRIYALLTKDLLALARARVTRSLTSDESIKYLHREDAAAGPAGESPVGQRPSTEPPPAKGLIFQITSAPTGGLDDRSINQLVHGGIQAAVKQFGWASAARESMQYSDYARLIAEGMAANSDLIVMAFAQFTDVAKAAARADPNRKFLLLGVAHDEPPDNIWGQVYAIDQAAFLAGYLAASMTKTGKVGTFGAIPRTPLTLFMDGFALGAAHFNAKRGARVQVLGWDPNKREGLFAGDFIDAGEGSRMAETLIAQGADVIMPVAGSVVGMGAIDIAQKHQAYFIGVDTDWVVTAPEYAPIILTSVENRMDVSLIAVVKAIVDGKFVGGTHVGTLATCEVGLSPFHELDALVPPQVKSELEEIKAAIIAGEIKTLP